MLEVETMDIKPIKTDADYRAILKEIESLMRAAPDTSEGEKLDALVTLVEAYEHIALASGFGRCQAVTEVLN